MPHRSGVRGGFALALLSASCFGVLPIVGKLAFAEGFAVGPLLAWRFALAAALLWPLALLRGGLDAVSPRQWLALFTLGAFYAGNSALYFLALERIPATTTSLVFYVYPAIVAVIGAVFLNRRMRPPEILALAATLAGVALTVGLTSGRLDPLGVGLALASAGMIAVYFVLGELALAGVPTLEATATILTGSALVYLAWEGVAGSVELPASRRAWLVLGAIAVLSTALAIVAMLGAIRRIGAGTTSIVNTLEPAVTAALAALFLKEVLAPRQYAGAALIVGGVALLRLSRRSQPKTPAQE